eukprot:6186741-Pleurochrysis_carterae.AAC.1
MQVERYSAYCLRNSSGGLSGICGIFPRTRLLLALRGMGAAAGADGGGAGGCCAGGCCDGGCCSGGCCGDGDCDDGDCDDGDCDIGWGEAEPDIMSM